MDHATRRLGGRGHGGGCERRGCMVVQERSRTTTVRLPTFTDRVVYEDVYFDLCPFLFGERSRVRWCACRRRRCATSGRRGHRRRGHCGHADEDGGRRRARAGRPSVCELLGMVSSVPTDLTFHSRASRCAEARPDRTPTAGASLFTTGYSRAPSSSRTPRFRARWRASCAKTRSRRRWRSRTSAR